MFELMIVGCGVRGRSWARAIKDNPSCKVSSYVDINKESLERIKGQYGDSEALLFTDLNKALEEGNVDGVILATPPQLHYEQSKLILNKGFHLLAEKPLTEEFDTSLDLVKMAENLNLILIVGMQFRYMPVTQSYKKLIDDKKFGNPNFSQFSYIRTRDPMNYGGRVLNQYCNDMAHTFLLEQAIHHLDLVRFVYSSDFEWVQTYEWNPVGWDRNPYKQDPNVSALLCMSNGMHVNYMGTWISGNVGINNGIDFRWRTDCEKGVIVQPMLFGENGLYIASSEAGEMTHVDTGPITPFATDTDQLLVEFYDSWKSHEPPSTSGKDHLKTLATILACIKSSVTGKRIYMKDFYEEINFPKKWI